MLTPALIPLNGLSTTAHMSHQRSQSVYFVTHISALRNNSFARAAVQAVLARSDLDDLPGALVAADGEGQAQHMVTGLDNRQDATHLLLLLLLRSSVSVSSAVLVLR